MTEQRYLCRLHPDFHLPADIDVGVGFDGDAYARRLKASGVDSVVFFAKCHYGHSYYDTKVGHRHPRLKKDMLRDVVAGCRQHSLGVSAYFSVFLDSAAIAAHPDWTIQSTRTSTDAGFDSGNFRPVCVNSPYLEELFIPQAVEVATGYEVDELFFDTMTGFNPCYCPHCRKLFGQDIPDGPTAPNWLEYVRWYASRYEAFYARTAEAVRAANPAVGVIFNWEWGIRRPITPPPGITYLAADLIATGTVASLQTRYFAGTGFSSDYMTGRFLHGLGEWDSNTPESLKYTAAATVANGSGFYLIDRQLPDGSLEPRAYTAMQDVFGFLQPRREFLLNTRHVPEIAVLHSHDHLMGPRLEFFPDSNLRKKRIEPLDGVVRLFIEHARHFTALSAENLQRRISEYRLVIVPEQEYLSPPIRASLAAYVQNGGCLLLTQSDAPDTVDRDLLTLAGVQYEGHGPLHYAYLDGPDPILIRGHLAQVKPTDGAQTYCRSILPMNAGGGGAKFGHGFSPPTVPGPFPAATCRQLGKGRIVYAALPLFKAYQNNQNPHLARLLLSWIDQLLPDPLVRASTPAQVEMSVMRKKDDLIIHLVNHSGRERLGGYYYPCTEYIPEIRGIELAIREKPGVKEVLSVPANKKLKCRRSGGCLHLLVPPLHVMESLCVPGYFANV